MANRIVAVVGPTASGKTAVAVALAQRFSGAVISADSMQIYRGMDIGTAKPDAAERGGVRHELIDIVDPDEPFTLADWLDAAERCAQSMLQEGLLPILAGGTGLYVTSFLDHVRLTPAKTDPDYRAYLTALAAESGDNAVYELLEAVDPDAAKKIHPNNTKRLIRALEIYKTSGVTATEQNRRSRLEQSPYEFCVIGLTFADRQNLYNRIDRRVDEMFDRGLEQEVRSLARYRETNAFQAIGYRQFLPYFDGECSLDAVRAAIKTESRRYAKRQLTWLRRDPRIRWFEVDRFENPNYLLDKIVKTIEIFLNV